MQGAKFQGRDHYSFAIFSSLSVCLSPFSYNEKVGRGARARRRHIGELTEKYKPNDLGKSLCLEYLASFSFVHSFNSIISYIIGEYSNCGKSHEILRRQYGKDRF